MRFYSSFASADSRWQTRHTPNPDLPAGDFAPKYTDDGRLALRLRARDGIVHTSHLYVPDQPFVYGRFEARMRFSGGPKGAHSCFWLQDVEPDHIGGSEVDIVENFGDDNTVWHNVYWRDSPETMWPERPNGVQMFSKFDLDRLRDWHVYRLDWHPDRYEFYIDNTLTATITEGVSSRPKHMILSYLSSTWEWPRLQRDNLSQYRTMVDWVRVSD